MNNLSIPLTIIIILLSAVFMLINPRETVQAASQGLALWYTAVLPALFPFFVVAELSVKMRLVNFLGVLLEPIMRPLFRLPGCSSLVVVMGFTSGFPVGAVLTRKLYEQDLLSADEAERLVSFTNNASPLFVLGAVGVGMLGSPSAGYLLAIAHYLSNLMVGWLWRFKGAPVSGSSLSTSSRITAAFHSLQPDSTTEPEGIGKILGDTIKNSLNNILAVGGFIVVFSVLTRMLSNWGFIDFLAAVVLKLLGPLNISYHQAYGLCMGIFEMTLGTKTTVSDQSNSTLILLIVISAILACSGLSIIAQVMSVMAGTPVRWSFYLLSRSLQVVFSCLITWLAYRIALIFGIATIKVNSIPFYKVLYAFNAWSFSMICMAAAGAIILLLFITSICWPSKKTY